MGLSKKNGIEIKKCNEKNVMKKVRDTEIKTFNSMLFPTLESPSNKIAEDF